jgi:CBS domain-containing protein
MNAAEIMTKQVVTVRPDTSVGEIADLLLDHKVSAVPVIDDDRHVVGIVSEGDLPSSFR